jgi:hypothetical protein
MKKRADFLFLAAYNNAVWCDTICRSHNKVGEFYETFWVQRDQAPPYYPNLVTLSPLASLEPQQAALAELLTGKLDYSVSVKDSFAVLDLAPFGFQRLFQAQWIMRQALPVTSHPEIADLQWRRITSAGELLRWEEAWSQTTLSSHQLFLPALLHDVDVSFLVAYNDNIIVAGAIANQTMDVVGLSNVFTPAHDAAWFWDGLLALMADCYPGMPVVGYEQDESLSLALHAGFTLLGPLWVWLKEV